MHLDRTSRRILGSLVEKRYSTPEQYPLTLNSLVLACNQRSNRDPETSIEEFIVEGCLKQLRIDGWVTVVERDFGRAVRYSERLSDQIGLTKPEAAVMAELMLRGPQTEQELQRRTERMCRIATIDEALAVLQGLAARGLVRHLARETGQRVARWEHLLTPPGEASDGGTAASGAGRSSPGLHPSGAPAGHVSWVGSRSSGVAAAAGAAHAPGAYQPPTTQPAYDPPSPADIDYVPPPGTPDPGWSVTAFPPRNPPPPPVHVPAAPPAAAAPVTAPVVHVAAAPAPTPPVSPVSELATLRAEIVALKAEVASLRAEVIALRGGSRPG